jgi:hypothetical protein
MIDPEVAQLVIKSLAEPASLSLEELRIMDSYLLAAVNEHRRRLVTAEMGLDAEFGAPENMLMFYFGNRFAKTWWNRFKGEGEAMDFSLLELDAEIAEFEEDWTISLLESLRSELQSNQN